MSGQTRSKVRGKLGPGPKSELGFGLLGRLAIGGYLMGAANLVPGISGGTMLVAAGVYQLFIDAVGDAARLRLSVRTVAVLGVAVIAAAAAFVTLTQAVVWGLTEARWAMYSLFIGLTLGGVPVMAALVRASAGTAKGKAWAAGAAGAAVMAGLAFLQSQTVTSAGGPGTGAGAAALYAVGGVAGAASMILPGLSGAFVLLILGLYEPIVGSIKGLLDAARAGDVSAAMAEMSVLVPVGVGVVVGVAVIGSGLKWVLKRYERVTLAFLLGLLVSAPLGLYPFRAGVEPAMGDVIKGETIETEAQLAEALEDPKEWRQEVFAPSAGQLGGAVGLVVVGFGATVGIGLIGGRGGKGGAAAANEAGDGSLDSDASGGA